jgi:7-cyano-7-deazaguanine synthase in queuosine biosynthesis
MKKIKLFENFNNSRLLDEINSISDKYDVPMLDTIDNSINRDFISYLWNIADIKHIDALGGTESKDSFRRYSISHLVEFDKIIHMADTGIGAGIKIVKTPLSRLSDYELWSGGYIEGFIRMDSDDSRFSEYFIWTYIRMEKLPEIIEKYGHKLELLQ